MWRRSSGKRISVIAVAAVSLVSSFGLLAPGLPPIPSPSPLPPLSSSSRVSAPAQATKSSPLPVAKPPSISSAGPAPLLVQSYIGASGCFGCHRPQAQVWGTTKHSHEFSDLPSKYRNDPSCLQCHVTGYGKVDGYVGGAPTKSSKDLAQIGCEACHGPGALHENAAQRFANADNPADEAKLEKEMQATIRKTPPDSVCAACHKTQGHQRHPAYEGQPCPQCVAGGVAASCVSACPVACDRSWETRDYPAVGTTIKSCGACHYRQYQNWTTEKHAALSADLPVKYMNDRDCLKCHTPNYKASGGFLAAADANIGGNRLGVACESCHGPGREHVTFNRQFISSPPLGPELEQMARQMIHKGKAANTCIECHAIQSHKEHPKYDKP